MVVKAIIRVETPAVQVPPELVTAVGRNSTEGVPLRRCKKNTHDNGRNMALLEKAFSRTLQVALPFLRCLPPPPSPPNLSNAPFSEIKMFARCTRGIGAHHTRLPPSVNRQWIANTAVQFRRVFLDKRVGRTLLCATRPKRREISRELQTPLPMALPHPGRKIDSLHPCRVSTRAQGHPPRSVVGRQVAILHPAEAIPTNTVERPASEPHHVVCVCRG